MTGTDRKAIALFQSTITGLLLLAGGAQAASVGLVSESRYLRSSGDVFSDTRQESWSVTESSPFASGRFDVILDESRTAGDNTSSGYASIVSDIGPNLFEAAGTASASTIVNTPRSSGYARAEADARSHFEVKFTLYEQMAFDLSSFVEFDSDDRYARGAANFSLASEYFNLSLGEDYIRSNFSKTFALSGLLDAGTYTMRVFAEVDTDYGSSTAGSEMAVASYDVSLQLKSLTAPIPLPAAAWLFVSAIAVLGFNRRRAV